MPMNARPDGGGRSSLLGPRRAAMAVAGGNGSQNGVGGVAWKCNTLLLAGAAFLHSAPLTTLFRHPPLVEHSAGGETHASVELRTVSGAASSEHDGAGGVVWCVG